MQQYKLIIFDWDGTLIDSIGLIADCLKKVAQEFKVPVPTNEEIQHFIGYNADTHLLALFSSINKERALACYMRHYDNKERLVPGAIQTLKLLKKHGILLTIATNNSRLRLEKSTQYHKLAKFFTLVKTTDDSYIKPQPAMALTILQELNIQRNHTLMVGDSTTDMLFAKNAGIDAIAVTYGLHSKKDLLNYSPIACIDHLEQLLDFIG